MRPYHRPEKQTDPDKLPGQIVNRPPPQDPDLLCRPDDNVRLYGGGREGGKAVRLSDIISRIEREAEAPPCCHKTVIERCPGCPYELNSILPRSA